MAWWSRCSPPPASRCSCRCSGRPRRPPCAGAALGVAGVVALALGRLLATATAMPATALARIHRVGGAVRRGRRAAGRCWPGAAATAAESASPRASRGPAADGLTGLPTRQFFEGAADRCRPRRCDSKKAKLAVLFIDLDGFKPVNDTYGHACGDRVLEQVGVRLRSITRGSGRGRARRRRRVPDAAAGVSSQESVSRVARR